MQFYISCLWGGGDILPNLTNSQEPESHVFDPLEPEQEPEQLEKEHPEPEPLLSPSDNDSIELIILKPPLRK